MPEPAAGGQRRPVYIHMAMAKSHDESRWQCRASTWPPKDQPNSLEGIPMCPRIEKPKSGHQHLRRDVSASDFVDMALDECRPKALLRGVWKLKEGLITALGLEWWTSQGSGLHEGPISFRGTFEISVLGLCDNSTIPQASTVHSLATRVGL